MFEKHRVAFTNKDIFGPKFRPALEASFCVLSKMLFAGKIDIDGTLDMKNEVNLSKKELWSYIYYLFYHNHMKIPEFKAMKNPENGKASAERFYDSVMAVVYKKSVKQVKPMDVSALIVFINKMIGSHTELANPVINYLKVLLLKMRTANARVPFTGISGIGLITGVDGKTGLQIVTDPREVANANVKISIIPADS